MLSNTLSACSSPAKELYDDFNYTDAKDPALAANGWQVRSSAGGPGPEGALWSSDSITFVDDPAQPGNKLLQLSAVTTGSQVVQAEINSPFLYKWGTFAARVKFSNLPLSGPDGDQIVETFFTIAPWQSNTYSELDFEYLANGGWGKNGPRLWMTSWDTPQKNDHSDVSLDLGAGWHNLLVTATTDQAVYSIDGIQLGGPHVQPYAPKTLMAIDFNLWFIKGGTDGPPRTYIEQVDWVYHVMDVVLTQAQVDRAVKKYRSEKKNYIHTIP